MTLVTDKEGRIRNLVQRGVPRPLANAMVLGAFQGPYSFYSSLERRSEPRINRRLQDEVPEVVKLTPERLYG